MKKIYKLLKKIVLSGFTILALNIIAKPLNVVIPINVGTVAFMTNVPLIFLPFFAIIILFFS